MMRIVRRERSSADDDAARSPRISVTSAASMATSVPEPIAMPTSAWASAGASLMPSPTMATTSPVGLQRGDLARLVLGQHLGQHALDPRLPGDGLGGRTAGRR